MMLLVQVLMCGSTTVSGGTPRSTVQQRSARPTPSGCCWHALVRSSTLATTARECVLALWLGSLHQHGTQLTCHAALPPGLFRLELKTPMCFLSCVGCLSKATTRA